MKIQTIIRVVLVIGMFITGAILYKYMPETVPTHWNYEGVVDGYSGKTFGTFMTPGIALLMLIFFPLLSKIDPKKENYESFKSTWAAIQTSLICVFAYIYALQLYFTFTPENSYMMGRMMVFGMGILFVFMGNLLGKVRQNYFIGIKTPWTLNDPEVWQKSQRFGGYMMVLGGIAFLIEALIWQYLLAFLIIFITLVAIVPIVYSYVISRKKQAK
jgi:uncharacterized membrane protein